MLTLAACAPVKSTPMTDGPSPAVSPTQVYPLSTSSSEPIKTPTTVPSSTPIKQNTPLPPATLTPLPAPSGQPLAEMQISYLKMFDANTGWAIYSPPFIRPENSQVLRTTNGIQTWNDITPPISENTSVIRTAYFIDANTAIVVSTHSHLPQSTATDVFFWHTVNGGQTWQLGETLTTEIPDFYPDKLAFIDQQQGWMLGESDSGMSNMSVYFFATQDGGIHWEKVYDSNEHLSDIDTLWIKGFYPYSEHLTFVSGNDGFFSDGRLFASQDGGTSWTFRSLNPPDDLPDLECKTSNCKYLDTASAPRYTSPQDGVLIRRVYLNSETTMDVFVYYPNTKNRLPLPVGQYLYYTHDGGQTWIPKSSPALIGTVYFSDARLGWMLGKNESDPQAPTILYQTTDGGDAWFQITADCPLPLGSAIQFIDEQTGFAFSPFSTSDFYLDFNARLITGRQSSLLFVTNDGGYSWEKIEPQVIP